MYSRFCSGVPPTRIGSLPSWVASSDVARPRSTLAIRSQTRYTSSAPPPMPPYSNGTNTSCRPSSSPDDIRRTSASGNSSRSSSSISRESGSSRLAKSSIDASAVLSMSALSSLAMVEVPLSVPLPGSLGHRGRLAIGQLPPDVCGGLRTWARERGRTVGAMNIAVAVRLMPKAGEELELDPDGTDIDREFVDQTICDFDDQALEEAVLIKEATGATVTAVGLQTEGIEEALRVAYARGADRVVTVDAGDIDPYDSRTAAVAFAEATRLL